MVPSPRRQVREAPATAIGFLTGPDDRESIAALRVLASSDGDRLAVSAAIIALGECGGEDARLWLLAMLQADTPFVSAQAAMALGVYCARVPHAATLALAWQRCSNLQEKGAFAVALSMARPPMRQAPW